MLIASVRDKAAMLPQGAGLAELAVAALSRQGTRMSTPEMHRLAADAITQAQHVSYLLGKLAGLLDEDSDGGGRD
jgi:hypothetical protein